MNRLKKITLLIIIASVFFVVIKYIPNWDKISLYKAIPTFKEGNINTVVEDKNVYMKHPPVIVDNYVMLPVDFVKDYIDPYLFWDEDTKKLTITTQNKVIRMQTDQLTYYINQSPINFKMPVRMIENVPYLPINDFKELFGISVSYDKKYNLILIDSKKRNIKTGVVNSKNTVLRMDANIKSPILDDIKRDTKIKIFKETPEWFYIRTPNGLLGYISKATVGNVEDVKYEEKQTAMSTSAWKPQIGKINMTWEQLSRAYPAATQKINGVDIVSPTWFEISSKEGDIGNIADKAYVDRAHQNGYKVWALITNDFNSKLTHQVLSNTDIREKIIKQILLFASMYELDGINVDFESIAKEDGTYYIQFLRELAPYLKAQGITLSVDVYIPSVWTEHYNRTEIAKVADYVCIMAYDEHFGNSKESGSVASIDWVEKGIQETLKEVPKEKTILGIPFYTRLWKEEEKDGAIKVSSKSLGMKDSRNLLQQNNASIVWNEQEGQNYGEYKLNSATYKIWLEDETSIMKKLQLVEKYDLAGVASWKKGLETQEIWDLLYKALKK